MWDFIVSAIEIILKFSVITSVLLSIFVDKKLWRLSYAIPSYFAFIFLIFIPLLLLGYILIPITALFGAYYWVIDEEKEDKGEDPDVAHFTWKFMKLWDNWEDGIANTTYKEYDSDFKQIIYWSCFRNPVNNLRIMPLLSFKIDSDKVQYVGSKDLANLYDRKPPEVEWFFAWHGFYSNIWIQFKMFGKVYRFWQGWKIFPQDIFGVKGHRALRTGFAQQFKKLD